MQKKFHYMYLPNVIECKNIGDKHIENKFAKFDVIFKFKSNNLNKTAKWKQMKLSLKLKLLYERKKYVNIISLAFQRKIEKK